MEIREAVKNKENYGSIVTYFKTLETFDMDHMVLLIDTINQMSPEIYEHYRALQDIFRRQLRLVLEDKGNSDGRCSYLVRKGIETGTLLKEKYEQYI